MIHKWTTRKSNAQYDIYDCELFKCVLSITVLHPHQKTNGHAHDHPEDYHAIKGNCILILDGIENVLEPDMGEVTIYGGVFHQVINNTDKDMVFSCLWRKE
jgi:quercetin dioxygenase-like cupin family protein